MSKPASVNCWMRTAPASVKSSCSAAPKFETLVEPLEELQHRLSCAWSPVSHLNGVLNNEALRERYNACLPLLSDYATDISQNETLFRAFSAVKQGEAATLDGEQLARGRPHAAASSAWPASASMANARSASRTSHARAVAAWPRSSRRTCSTRPMPSRTTLPTPPSSRASTRRSWSRRSERAAAAGKDGWLLGLDQPTYVAVVTDARSPALRQAFYRAWCTRASDQGPTPGEVRQRAR